MPIIEELRWVSWKDLLFVRSSPRSPKSDICTIEIGHLQHCWIDDPIETQRCFHWVAKSVDVGIP